MDKTPQISAPVLVHVQNYRPIPEAGFLGRWVAGTAGLFAWGIVLAAFILLLEVFLRYVLNLPTAWAHETTTMLCGLAFVFGGLYCTSLDRHIRVVAIYDLLSPKARRAMDVAISLISCAAALCFTYAAVLMVGKALFAPDGSFRAERTGSAWNPPSPAIMKTFLLTILILLAVQFMILAWNHARRPLDLNKVDKPDV